MLGWNGNSGLKEVDLRSNIGGGRFLSYFDPFVMLGNLWYLMDWYAKLTSWRGRVNVGVGVLPFFEQLLRFL